MNRTEHVESLFSPAFDDELAPRQRAEFDAHLFDCPTCAMGFVEYRNVLTTVRALPPVAMPVRVRLPHDVLTTPTAWQRMARSLRRGRGVPTALGLVAAAAIIVFALHGNPVPTGGSSVATVTSPLVGNGSALAPAAPRAAEAQAAATPAGCRAALLTVTQRAAVSPTNDTDSITVGNPATDGTHITLSVPSATVTAGTSVSVWASATVSPTGVAAPGTATPAPLAFGPCIVVKSVDEGTTTTQIATVNGGGFVDVQLPPTLRKGDRVTVEALVPAASGGNVQVPALQATLTLTVG